MINYLSNRKLEELNKELKDAKTVNAGANIENVVKSAVIGNEQNNTNSEIDLRVVKAALDKFRA